MDVLWFFPTSGDERYLGSPIGRRATTFDYLKQIASALDSLGYYGALLPTGTGCEDAWVIASALMAGDAAAAFSDRDPPLHYAAGAVRTDGGDIRSYVEWPAADQRGHRQRTGGDGRRTASLRLMTSGMRSRTSF